MKSRLWRTRRVQKLGLAQLDGVEVYNVFTNARRVNPVVAFFDVLWSQRAYPELIFANWL